MSEGDMEELKAAVRRIESGEVQTRESIAKAHERIDGLHSELSKTNAEIATTNRSLSKIEGCMEPLCKNVERITDFAMSDHSHAGGESKVMLGLVEVMKYGFAASVIGIVIVTVGYFLNVNAKDNKGNEISVQSNLN